MADNMSKAPLCMAPFSQMVFKPDGQTSPCCYLYQHDFGHIKEAHSIQQLFNGPRFRQIRSHFLAGRTPKICRHHATYTKCYKNFEHLRSFDQEDLAQKQTKPPRRLDVRLNGRCNLSCVMCEIWQQPNGVYDGSVFWQKAPGEVFPYLESIEILGGEPFIQKDTFRLIEEISAVNDRCRFSFVTNGHYHFSSGMKKRLDKIKIDTLHISVDSLTAETYAKIRKKGDLAVLKKNIESVYKYNLERKEGFSLVFSMVVLQENRFEIEDFFAFAKAYGAKAQFQYAHYDPSFSQSLKFLSAREKKDYLDYLEGFFDGEKKAALASIKGPLFDEIKGAKLKGEMGEIPH